MGICKLWNAEHLNICIQHQDGPLMARLGDLRVGPGLEDRQTTAKCLTKIAGYKIASAKIGPKNDTHEKICY